MAVVCQIFPSLYLMRWFQPKRMPPMVPNAHLKSHFQRRFRLVLEHEQQRAARGIP